MIDDVDRSGTLETRPKNPTRFPRLHFLADHDRAAGDWMVDATRLVALEVARKDHRAADTDDQCITGITRFASR